MFNETTRSSFNKENGHPNIQDLDRMETKDNFSTVKTHLEPSSSSNSYYLTRQSNNTTINQQNPNSDFQVDHENDLIQLDLHYKKLLKTERDEFSKLMERQVAKTEKHCEVKFKSKLEKMTDL